MGAVVRARHSTDENRGKCLSVDFPREGRCWSAAAVACDPQALRAVDGLAKKHVPGYEGNKDVQTVLDGFGVAHTVSVVRGLPAQGRKFAAAAQSVAQKRDDKEAWKALGKASFHLAGSTVKVAKAADKWLDCVELPAFVKVGFGHFETASGVIKLGKTMPKVYVDLTKAEDRTERAQCVVILVGAIFGALKIVFKIVKKFGHDVDAQPVVAKAMEIGAICMALGLMVHKYRELEKARILQEELAAESPFAGQSTVEVLKQEQRNPDDLENAWMHYQLKKHEDWSISREYLIDSDSKVRMRDVDPSGREGVCYIQRVNGRDVMVAEGHGQTLDEYLAELSAEVETKQ
ncbi:hypothetical protein K0U07_01225 [bacterium]|nr:hypothetical protein [bacterium]